VDLGHGQVAVFDGAPINRLVVRTEGAFRSHELPYFEPEGYSDEMLAYKVKTRATFS